MNDYAERMAAFEKQITVGTYAMSNEKSLSLREFILTESMNIDYPLIIDFFDQESTLNHKKKRLQEMTETVFHGFEALQDGESRILMNTGRAVFLFYMNTMEDISIEDRSVFNNILSTFKFIE